MQTHTLQSINSKKKYEHQYLNCNIIKTHNGTNSTASSIRSKCTPKLELNSHFNPTQPPIKIHLSVQE